MKLLIISLLGCFALSLVSGQKIKWCVTSQQELNKCNKLAEKASDLECFLQDDVTRCMISIKDGAADAITVNAENVYKGGLINYKLHPIIEEKYKKGSEACYAVALVKKDTTFTIKELSGKASCHMHYKSCGGWNIPIGRLISEKIIPWDGPEDKSVEKAVSEFFTSSCVPGLSNTNLKGKFPNLCKGCNGPCVWDPTITTDEPLECLKRDSGQVAFLCHNKIPSAEKQNYELLCLDGSKKSVDEYKDCNLGKEPGHAVISRNDAALSDKIYKVLTETLLHTDLFSSDYGKDLLFSDSAAGLIKLPKITDSFLFLKEEYYEIMRALKDGPKAAPPSPRQIQWCAVGHKEKDKCDFLSPKLSSPTYNFVCLMGSSVDECIEKVKLGEADAFAADGAQVSIAQKCGLVSAMVEQSEEGNCGKADADASSYFVVAVVRKGLGVTWNTLEGKKSCHTGLNRNAGWTVPQAVLCEKKKKCNMYEFFSEGCAPGADINSNMCKLCKGSEKAVGGEASKCKPNADEQYYGYDGAFRCLVEKAGDVAFIKHNILLNYKNGNRPEWAKDLNLDDFELLCPSSPDNTKQISEFKTCNWINVPAHAVITREDIRRDVVTMLNDAQNKLDLKREMFTSSGGRNLLFSDSTKCLEEITDQKKFSSNEYYTLLEESYKIPDITPELVQACTLDNYVVEN